MEFMISLWNLLQEGGKKKKAFTQMKSLVEIQVWHLNYEFISATLWLSFHEVKVTYTTKVWQALWAAQPNRSNPQGFFWLSSISQLSDTL